MVESFLAKAIHKWVLLIGHVYHKNLLDDYSNTSFDFDEAIKCLGIFGKQPIIVLDGATVMCDSKEECEFLFTQIVGDDGPTENNQYVGPYRAYACTFGPDGQAYNENT